MFQLDIKSVLNRIKVGAILAPTYIIVLYFGFIIVDLITTFYFTPDLKYEGNYLVRYFKLNGVQFITLYLSCGLITILGFVISIDYLSRLRWPFLDTERGVITKEILKNKQILICFIFLGIFYSHIINIGLILINNFFIIYITGSSYRYNLEVSVFYVNNQNYFLFCFQTLPILLGYLIAYKKIIKIRVKVLKSDVLKSER